jgi:hypothetical protein
MRRMTEVGVHTRTHDFVLGHNLMLLHGGLGGGPSRLLLPTSIVVDEPADYPPRSSRLCSAARNPSQFGKRHAPARQESSSTVGSADERSVELGGQQHRYRAAVRTRCLRSCAAIARSISS